MARLPHRSVQSASVRTAPRCAIYTRKSTDEGLDSDFNSLDAQREIAEAYIASQRHENWIALPTRYDDGGYTGANTNRPALQQLLADVQAGRIDCVVVYRYDRLSRSLLDFLHVLELFKRHEVEFVSVSERFDTSTPHGEMALNMVLSVAQCERKVIGQRTRDKMRAARKRGKWTGGWPPLGYDVVSEGGKLVVNPQEAEQVRGIFERFAGNPSLVGVVQQLNRCGERQKSWTTKQGKARQGGPWNKNALRNLLANPLYLGQQKLGSEVFPGEHPAIVPRKLYQKVQRLLNQHRPTRRGPSQPSRGFLLRGLLRCVACDAAMTSVWTRPRKRQYRYYRCLGAIKRGHAACPAKSLPAGTIEGIVVERIRLIAQDTALREETHQQLENQARDHRRGLEAEEKRLQRERDAAREEVERVEDASHRAGSAAGRERAQQRLQIIESRLGRIQDELAALKTGVTDLEALGKACAALDSLWDVLLSPERQRILGLLIDRIDYDGRTRQIAIVWRVDGFQQLAEEVGE